MSVKFRLVQAAVAASVFALPVITQASCFGGGCSTGCGWFMSCVQVCMRWCGW